MEPTSDDAKEVYARFGLAYYLAEALHRGLSVHPGKTPGEVLYKLRRQSLPGGSMIET